MIGRLLCSRASAIEMDEPERRKKHRRKRKRPIYVPESTHGRFAITQIVTLLFVALFLIWFFLVFVF